jgi:MoxR-like ATPase
MNEMHNLKQIQVALNTNFYDRREEIDALLIALLSRQHVLFIGPAGTGKSALSSMLGKVVKDSAYFQHLLTPFSTPEELFGVLSLKDLEQGIYKRNMKDMLPEAHFAFVDEIFKANASILNSLLTLINERVYYNNGVPVQSPLMTIVGSSNEYIEEGEGLEALFDRFLLRYEVNYIREQTSFISMLKGVQHVSVPQITLDELMIHQVRVEALNVPEEVFETLAMIRQQLQDEGIRPSDRRFKQSISLLKARAYLEGRTSVVLGDLKILGASLWETIDQKEKTVEIILHHAQDPVESFMERCRLEFEEVIQNADKYSQGSDEKAQKMIQELMVKGKTLVLDIETMQQQYPNRTELEQLRKDMRDRLVKMTAAVIGF